jgi:hypothetical protein
VTDVGGWTVTAAGLVLVLIALRDIFHTIWHPGGRGGLTRRLMTAVWWVGRRTRRRGRLHHLSGPLAMVAVVFVWLTMIVLGWSLVYWPHLPESFVYSAGLDPSEHAGPLDAFYLSMVTLATLGFGDIAPVETWLRIAVAVEALIGFALLTAAVSWVLEVYPALTRRRSLAVRLTQLRKVDTHALLRDGRSAIAPGLLLDLAATVAQLRGDLTQYAETYYFRDGDPEASLPTMFTVLLELADEGLRSGDPDLRYAGELLRVSAEDYLRVIDEVFLGTGGSPGDICAAYADDHRHASARSS